MLKKVAKPIFFIILCALLAVVQFSFFGALTGAWQQINLGLMLGLFILYITGLRSALIFVFIFGFFLDILSFAVFGYNMISLGAAIATAYFFLYNWLTNRSLYSFWAAILAAVTTYHVLGSILIFIENGFRGGWIVFEAQFWQAYIYQFFWIFLFATLLFSLVTSWIKKFKPFFLGKKMKV